MFIHRFQQQKGKSRRSNRSEQLRVIQVRRSQRSPYYYRAKSPLLESRAGIAFVIAAAAIAGTTLSWSLLRPSVQTPSAQIDGNSLNQSPSPQSPAKASSFSYASDADASATHGWLRWLTGSSHTANPDDYFSDGILPARSDKAVGTRRLDSAATAGKTAGQVAGQVTADLALEAAEASPKAEGAGRRPQPRLSVPRSLSPGTVVWVGGDPSLVRMSELLRYEFQRRFPGAEVDVRTNSTAAALKGVLDGSLDVAAISRSLTPDEEAQGLVAVPLARHKIAVLVGTDNAFDGSITNQQLAGILRGEITNWKQLGGADQPLRLVDRAANSATREALLSYPAFAGVTAKGAPAGRSDRLSDVAASLSVDGITYALIDQVSDDITNPDQVNRSDVKIVPLHQVMPDDPRYSISQPMVYVYKGPKPNRAAEAFLGYAKVLRKRGLLADGASLNARGSLMGNPMVRVFLVLLASGAGVFALYDLRRSHAFQGLWSDRLSAADRARAERLGELDFYDERGSTYVILTAPQVGDLRLQWMLADAEQAKLPLEYGGVLELRLYEYRPNEAIANDRTSRRHRPFRSYICDGPEGEMLLHYHAHHHGARYVAELGYLAADNRWIKVAESTALRPSTQNTFAPVATQGWSSAPAEG